MGTFNTQKCPDYARIQPESNSYNEHDEREYHLKNFLRKKS